jgi:hypothetical protein
MFLPGELPGRLTRCCFLKDTWQPVLILEKGKEDGMLIIMDRCQQRSIHWRLLTPGPPPARTERERIETGDSPGEWRLWSSAAKEDLTALEAWCKDNEVPIPANGQWRLEQFRAEQQRREKQREQRLQEQRSNSRRRIKGVSCETPAKTHSSTEVVASAQSASAAPSPPLKPRSQAQRDADLEMRLRHTGEHPCHRVRAGWRYVQQLKAEALAAA